MSLLTSVKSGLSRIFAPANEGATLANPPDWMFEFLGAYQASSGVSVTPKTVLGLSTVWACLNAGSRAFASVPLEVYKRMPDGGRESAADGPMAELYRLLHFAPNDEVTSAFFWRTMVANAMLRNNAFATIVRNGFGDVVEMYPVPNKDVQVKRDSTTKELYYLVKDVRYSSEQILHIRGMSFDGVVGADALTDAKECIGLAIALQDYAAKYFPNSTSPTAVIEIPTAMSDAQMKNFAEAFDKHNTGNANAHKRMFLTNGAKLNTRGQVNNQTSQFDESRDRQDKAICRIFGIPQSKAGIMSEAHYNNVESENIAFVRDFMLPWCREIEQQLNAKLLSLREQGRYYCEFNLEGLLRGDTAARAAFYKTMVEIGALTSNGVCARENFPKLEGGDRRMMSANLLPLDNTGVPLKPVVETGSQSQSTAPTK